MSYRVLVVDRERSRSGPLIERLAGEGFEVRATSDPGDPGNGPPYDLFILDASILEERGSGLLRDLPSRPPNPAAILITGDLSPTALRKAVSQGLSKVFKKPLDLELLVRSVREIRESSDIRFRYGLSSLVGKSPKTQAVLSLAGKVARTQASAIFIRGDSGTGKDLLARAIHYESPRADRPFITVLCTALQDTLMESELFGHEKGAFTDAKAQKKGLFEMADGGSIFLNEIGDMGPNLQAKLLRVLDEQTFRRVGGREDVRVDVRVIAATNRDLEQSIREGKFRADLFYRLNIFPIHLPPLCERKEDLPLLAEHFLRRNAVKYRREFTGISPKGLAKLESYDWPGNVRELRNVLERACALCPGAEILEDDLAFWRMGALPQAGRASPLPPGGVNLDQLEKDLVLQALEESGGNQTLAARLLGLSRFRLRSRMKRYGIRGTSPRSRSQGRSGL
jgi:two-component system response regulator AtoC